MQIVHYQIWTNNSATCNGVEQVKPNHAHESTRNTMSGTIYSCNKKSAIGIGAAMQLEEVVPRIVFEPVWRSVSHKPVEIAANNIAGLQHDKRI